MFIGPSEEIPSTLFQRDHEANFAALIAESAAALEEATGVIHKREGYDPEAEAEGIAAEIEEEGGETQEAYEHLVGLFEGDASFINEHIIGPLMGSDRATISEQDYAEAQAKKSEASTALIDYVCGYQNYMRKNLAGAYGHDDEMVSEEAWLATWKKLHGILFMSEGTLLAEVSLFFDGLVKEKFGKEYRPMEQDRGPAVNQDTGARTFYVVMEKHVHRAIVGANRDEWTGYQ